MLTLVAVLSSVLSVDACSDEEFLASGALASAALQEIAQQRGITELQAGGVLVTWRREACNLLDGDPVLFDATRSAIELECRQVDALPNGDEQAYVDASRKIIEVRSPDLVALVWATPSQSSLAGTEHIYIVTDGATAVRASLLGYGREGAMRSTCINSPWPLAATKFGG